MQKINLRPYQQKAVNLCRDAIRQGKKRMILCSPTGSGKTFMFSYMVALAIAKGKKALILTDRIELMKQTGGSLQALGVDPLEIKAGKYPDLSGQLYTAMVETLARRMKKPRYQKLIKSFDLIICDEAHKQAFNKLFPFISDSTVVIGATATPHRKGSQTALDEFYQTLIDVVQIPELIELGFLSRPISYGIPADLSGVRKVRGDYDVNQMGDAFTKNRVFDGVVDNYKRLTPGKKALAFSPNIESSQRLTAELQQGGINAKHLDSTMSKTEREEVLHWLKETPDAGTI
jgi:superfamily II DNA or RNA helicase